MAQKLLITGGPQGGKSTTLNHIQEEFRGRILCVPEAATILLSGGFPPPGEVPHPDDLAAFQRAIFSVIVSLEDLFMKRAAREGISLVLCDRGRLEGEAYMNSRAEFMNTVGITDRAPHLAAYDEVMYLESPVTQAGHVWSHAAGNEHRMEQDPQIAAAIERRTWEAWCDHRFITRLGHDLGYHGKYERVRARVIELLS